MFGKSLLMRCRSRMCGPFLATVSVLCGLHALTAAEDSRRVLEPFLTSHCHDCHGGGAGEGGLDLDELGFELSDVATFARWERIYDRVRDGEMPPEDIEQPTDQDRGQFTRALGGPLTQAHAAAKGTVMRRLNRREYQNTMNDLFGTRLDLESSLPQDGRTHEFDNVGASLSVSMVHLRQYLESVDRVMEAAIAKSNEAPEVITKKANYAETREGETHIGKAWKQLDDGAVVFFRSGGYPSGMLRTAHVRQAGRYRIRVTGYAYQSDAPITLAIGATTFARGAEKPTFAYRSLPPEEPATVEVEAWIEKNYMIDVTPWGISDSDGSIRKDGIENYAGPGLAILNVELTGPLSDQFPSRGHRLLFDGLDRREVQPRNPNDKTKSWYVPKFEVRWDDPREDADRVLLRVATAAFRRPVTAREVSRYTDLFETQMAAGAMFQEALQTAVAAIFCSPDFLYLREQGGWLSDYEIASRLSYFLARTAPDAELLTAAARGQLSADPAVLLAQTRRLLRDPRRRRFIVDFTDSWLNLRDIEFTSPDRTLFPEFDQFLQDSIVEESTRFLEVLIDDNLPVGNLAVSDFAMLNNRLALHYAIDGVTSPLIERVTLPANSVRGGLLGQASILKVSANGTNTSPVVRGVWVLERILGIHPPPPPAGIAGVEPDIRGASTLRELLAKHRNSDSCRSCHQLIDPPGFALESFNPIGGWRDRFRSLGEGERVDVEVAGRKVRYRIGPPVDSSGEFADGTRFGGFREFRAELAKDEDLLAGTLATKLLTFACGRPMGFSDRATIDDIVARSKASGHGIGELIELVVQSEVFRKK